MFNCCFRAPVSEVEYNPPRNTPNRSEPQLRTNSLHVNMKSIQEPKIKLDSDYLDTSETGRISQNLNTTEDDIKKFNEFCKNNAGKKVNIVDYVSNYDINNLDKKV